jgi:DNA repair protein RadC
MNQQKNQKIFDGLMARLHFEDFDPIDLPELREWDYLPERAKNELPTPTALPPDLRPREKLLTSGPDTLSDRELLSILLNSGIKGKNVSVLAGDLLDRLDRSNEIPPVKELAQMTGIGVAKASAVVAMLEFGRRRWGNRGRRIRTAVDLYNLIRHYADCRQERFLCVSMNGAHEVLATRIVTIGLVNRTIVHPREVFADVIQDRASAVCVAHNHPTGITKPSKEDDDITETLIKSATILGLHFLDHLIFTETDYYSYNAHGKINQAHDLS